MYERTLIIHFKISFMKDQLLEAGFVKSGAGFRKGDVEVSITDGRLYRKVTDLRARKGYRMELYKLPKKKPKKVSTNTSKNQLEDAATNGVVGEVQ